MSNPRMILAAVLATAALMPLVASSAILEVPNQYPTIGAAIAAAKGGDEIRISPGTYPESGLVLPVNVILTGTGASPADCVIDAQGKQRLLSIQFLAGRSVLRNLTLSGGRASGETSYEASGGAIFINSSPVTIENCHFLRNRASCSGGAVRCFGAGLELSDCRFEWNTAVEGGGALDLSYGASSRIDDSVFIYNRAGYGGALACRGDSSPIVNDCVIMANVAEGEVASGGGALTFFNSFPQFTRCVFRGNAAAYGGAIYNVSGAAANLSYCTLLQNAALEGAGLFVDNARPTIETSLIVFQTGDAVRSRGELAPLISCTDIYGNSGGDWVGGIASQYRSRGNLGVDPQFCTLDPDVPPMLREGSPATRALGACDDLGALGSGCATDIDDGDRHAPSLARTVANLGAYPNPFNPSTQIHFELGLPQRVRVDVYSTDGRRLRRLADRVYAAGSWNLRWDGTDDRGQSVASGSYLVVVTGEETASRMKVTLLK